MKAEIKDDGLWLIPENSTEEYAFDKWSKDQGLNPCTNEITTSNLWCYAYNQRPRESLLYRIKHKIELFLLNHKLIK